MIDLTTLEPRAVKALCASLDKVLADAIAEAWGRAQKEGMTLYDLSRMLNWSRHRTQRTMKSPVYCRGGLQAASRLMTYLGIYGFKDIELLREVEAVVEAEVGAKHDRR